MRRADGGVWAWLAECRVCRKQHELRPLTSLANEQGNPFYESWADPEDGHTYAPRMADWQLSALRKEWEETSP